MQFYKISYEVIGYCNLFLNWEKPVSKKKAKPNYKLNIKMKVVQPHPISSPIQCIISFLDEIKQSIAQNMCYRIGANHA